MTYSLPIYILLFCSTASFLASAVVTKQTMTFLVEEVHNGITFKHLTEVDNGITKESFTINGKSANAAEFDDALINAQKDETKKERKKNQEDRIKLYETQYKGRVKIAQADLKQTISSLEHELKKLSDGRIKSFMIYKSDTLSSAEHMSTVKEKNIPDAKKLAESSSESTDIKKINEAATELQALIPRVRETFIAAVNNGISKADDTKLLKELISLL